MWGDEFLGSDARCLVFLWGFVVEAKMKLAEQIHKSRASLGLLVDEIEDTFDTFWSSLDRVTTDYHDNSLEAYFEDHVDDLEPTEAELAEVWEWGFDRFWLNFKGGVQRGGTERLYLSPELQARIAARDKRAAEAAIA